MQSAISCSPTRINNLLPSGAERDGNGRETDNRAVGGYVTHVKPLPHYLELFVELLFVMVVNRKRHLNNLQRDPPRPRTLYNWTILFPTRDARTIYQCRGIYEQQNGGAISINGTWSRTQQVDGGITFCAPISWNRIL